MARKQPRERWKDIPGFPLYQVSDMGRIRTYKGANQYTPLRTTPKIMKQRLGADGYRRVTLQNGEDHKEVIAVHLLVARAFRGASKGRVVRHKDGDRSNAKLSNLEYGSQKENNKDKIGHGTDPSGERNAASLLTAKEVRDIRKLRKSINPETGRRWTQEDISLDFGISRQAVSDIVLRKTWTHL
jgi:hypothetical protein